MFKKLAALALAAVMTFSLAACGGGSSSGGSSSSGSADAGSDSGSGVIEISYIVKAKSDNFWTTMEKAANAYAQEKGVKLNFQAPAKETDVEQQVQMVENAVSKGVDAIILSAADSKSLIPAIVKANNANIPVILVNDTIDMDQLAADGGQVVTYVGISQYNAAKLAGDYAKENVTDGKVVYLEGIAGVDALAARLAGFRDQVTDVTTEVASQTANCDRNEAFNVMQNVLNANKDVNLVWAVNAEMGQGAVQAVDQAGLTGQVQIFDFDAAPDDLAAIEAGTLVGSVAQYPNVQAETAVQVAIDAIGGKTFEEHTETAAKLITKDNIEEYRTEMADYLD